MNLPRRSLKRSTINGLALFRYCIPALLALLMSGCAELSYYAQSARGQLDIIDRRQPIDALLEDDTNDVRLRERLARVKQIRAFAVNRLGLPDTGSYTRYADLERGYAVLALYAAPEFSVELRTWCYPVIGCAGYRGYFDEDMLSDYVEQLRQQNYDTYIATVPAYSTLGWFDDPVLNTVLDWQEPQLAGLIFHELSHQQLYIKGDTVFNESFATAVERAGVERWLRVYSDRRVLLRYRTQWQHRQQVTRLIADTRDALQLLYEQDLPQQILREEKQRQFDKARQAYAVLRKNWDEDPGYDAWFTGELNNAKLGAAQAYNAYVESFMAILAEQDENLPAFYEQAAAIGALEPDQRAACLESYLGSDATACHRLLEQ